MERNKIERGERNIIERERENNKIEIKNIIKRREKSKIKRKR